MSEKTAIKKIVISHSGKASEILESDILNIQTTESVEQYCGTYHVSLKNTNGKNTRVAEPRDEIDIWLGSEETGINKVMAGYIDQVVFEKREESGETMQINGRSYASVLLDTKVSGKIQYDNGLSQVLREVLKTTPLKPDGIQDIKGTGVVMFRNIPIIDLVRQITEECGWVFMVDHDKVFHFRSTQPSRNVGNITDVDMKTYRIVKGSRYSGAR